MTNLKETADKILKAIYSDKRIETKEYTELEALKEILNATEHLIKTYK